ncbi:MAG: NAD(P)-binding domain-containing protein [Phycisphaerae bacterium]|nr:NAD(P)-binding domain-containing protein [Phycisphaerae bacterium]
MKLGFIGTGKITAAVVQGLCTSGIDGLSIAVSPRNEATSSFLAQHFSNVRRMHSNQQVLDHADIVCIAVRPDQAAHVLSQLRFREDHIVVSFVSFLTCHELVRAVAPARQSCRAIPLPSVIHHTCPIPVFPAIGPVMDLFSTIGQPVTVDNETQLHALWTLTGLISPFYDLLGSLSDWTVSHGVRPDTASQFTADLFQSLAHAARQSDPIAFDALAHHAATPNGMNEQAAHEILASGAHQAYRQACDRLVQRFPILDE